MVTPEKFDQIETIIGQVQKRLNKQAAGGPYEPDTRTLIHAAEFMLAELRRDHGNRDRRGVAECVFCAIVAGEAPATVVAEWPDALAIVPHHPVVPGHVLVLPRTHVRDFADDPDATAATMRRAAELGRGPANLITSAGHEATQTVFHLHIHIVPRTEDDGLPLPWTSQQLAARMG